MVQIVSGYSLGTRLPEFSSIKFEILFWDPNLDFWQVFQDQNDFKKYSGIFPGHSGLILYHFHMILKEHCWTLRKINKIRYCWHLLYAGTAGDGSNPGVPGYGPAPAPTTVDLVQETAKQDLPSASEPTLEIINTALLQTCFPFFAVLIIFHLILHKKKY